MVVTLYILLSGGLCYSVAEKDLDEEKLFGFVSVFTLCHASY